MKANIKNCDEANIKNCDEANIKSMIQKILKHDETNKQKVQLSNY